MRRSGICRNGGMRDHRQKPHLERLLKRLCKSGWERHLVEKAVLSHSFLSASIFLAINSSTWHFSKGHGRACLVAQLCPTLCDPMDCSPPGSSVHEDSPGNTGMGCHALLQGIFPTQWLNPGLLYCRWILYHLSHQGSPRILEWVAYPFSRRSSLPRNQTGTSCIAGEFFTSWAIREAQEPQWSPRLCGSHTPLLIDAKTNLYFYLFIFFVWITTNWKGLTFKKMSC